MTQKKPLLLFILALPILLFNSCEEADNSVDPNIISKTFTATNWQSNSDLWYINFSLPELTSENINTAAVLVYFKTTGSWWALPYTEVASTNYFMTCRSNVSTIGVNWIYNGLLSNGDDPTTYYGTTLTYKVVIIPDQARKANPDIDWTNYEVVKTRFDLKD
ncbi:MAG: hypothetical protein ACRCYO_06805 [Bacteroidia bacterium]